MKALVEQYPPERAAKVCGLRPAAHRRRGAGSTGGRPR